MQVGGRHITTFVTGQRKSYSLAFTLVLKPSFYQSLSIYSQLSLAQANLQFDHWVPRKLKQKLSSEGNYR